MRFKFSSLVYAGILFAVILILGCNRQTGLTASEENLVIFPPPPDTTRIQFLTSISTSADLTGDQGHLKTFLFGKPDPRNIIKPYGVTVNKSRIYICDTGLGGIVILDLENSSFEYFIPTGKGQLRLPINCCMDSRNFLYVADGGRKQVVVFDDRGKFVNAFGEQENFRPTDILIHGGKIYVANVLNHEVCIYDETTLKYVRSFPGKGPGEEGFVRQPTNISMHEGSLYISDFGDFNIKKFAAEGKLTGVFGSYGNGLGQLTRPKGIAVDREGNLYCVDAAFDNVQIFNAGGDLLMYFGGSYEGPGALWLPAAIEISYENLAYFNPFVDESYELQYLVYVTNQYGPAKVNVYGFVKEKEYEPANGR